MKSLVNGSHSISVKNLTGKSPVLKNLTNLHVKDSELSFSFRFFSQIENFGIKGKNDTWTTGLLEQLRNLSGKNFDEIITSHSTKDGLRLHRLDLSTGKSALTENELEKIVPKEYYPQGDDCEFWQFQISKANGRVIGFFNENHTIFYIVLLDPNHNAQLSDYSDYKIRKIDPCQSELDSLRCKISKLIEQEHSIDRGDLFELLQYEDSVFLSIDTELLTPFEELLKSGHFQSKLQEFLLEHVS